MAWTYFSLIFIALTTSLAYKFPYPRYYEPIEDQSYAASQYRRVEDRSFGSFEQDTDIPDGYQERSSYARSNSQRRHLDSSQLNHERPVERSIPFGYNQQRDRVQVRSAPKLEDSQLRNGNSSYKIVNSLKSYPSLTNRRGVDTESAVVFPGPTSGTRKQFTPQVTTECGELGICESSPEYPYEHVEALLAKVQDASIRFNLDIETPEIAQRGGHEQPKSNQSVELCKPDVRIIYPLVANTKSGKSVYIINGKKHKVQGFKGTQCRAPGKPCEDLVYFPPNYVASCEQKMMDRYMWAIGDNGEMELVTVPMPSCCMCVLQAK